MLRPKNSAYSKTNRRVFYLARGDYEWPDWSNRSSECPAGTRRVEEPIAIARPRQSVANARVLLLDAAADLYPEILVELSGRLPALVRSEWNSGRDGLLNYAALQGESRLQTVRAELNEWSEWCHLTDRWCLEIALSTLTKMRHDGQLEWFEAQTHFGIPDPFRVSFAAPLGLPAYDPVYLRRADYLSRVRKSVNPRYQRMFAELTASIDSMNRTNSRDEEYRLMGRMRELGDRLPRTVGITKDRERRILDYVNRVETEARHQGLVKVPPELRQPRIFQWLAGHHLFGWTPRQIAGATYVYKSSAYHNTIVHGIKKLSAYIGLSPRKDRVLSPRGVKLACLVEKIRGALDPEQIDLQSQRLSRLPALFSDEVMREALQILKQHQRELSESVAR
jgi:hypothetical protein